MHSPVEAPGPSVHPQTLHLSSEGLLSHEAADAHAQEKPSACGRLAGAARTCPSLGTPATATRSHLPFSAAVLEAFDLAWSGNVVSTTAAGARTAAGGREARELTLSPAAGRRHRRATSRAPQTPPLPRKPGRPIRPLGTVLGRKGDVSLRPCARGPLCTWQLLPSIRRTFLKGRVIKTGSWKLLFL